MWNFFCVLILGVILFCSNGFAWNNFSYNFDCLRDDGTKRENYWAAGPSEKYSRLTVIDCERGELYAMPMCEQREKHMGSWSNIEVGRERRKRWNVPMLFEKTGEIYTVAYPMSVYDNGTGDNGVVPDFCYLWIQKFTLNSISVFFNDPDVKSQNSQQKVYAYLELRPDYGSRSAKDLLSRCTPEQCANKGSATWGCDNDAAVSDRVVIMVKSKKTGEYIHSPVMKSSTKWEDGSSTFYSMGDVEPEDLCYAIPVDDEGNVNKTAVGYLREAEYSYVYEKIKYADTDVYEKKVLESYATTDKQSEANDEESDNVINDDSVEEEGESTMNNVVADGSNNKQQVVENKTSEEQQLEADKEKSDNSKSDDSDKEEVVATTSAKEKEESDNTNMDEINTEVESGGTGDVSDNVSMLVRGGLSEKSKKNNSLEACLVDSGAEKLYEYDCLKDYIRALEEAKKREQSLANRMLGAVAMGAGGIGGMMMASGLAESATDADAERDMRAYLATFKCDYGAGMNIKGGESNIELPGAGELIPLYSEYVALANDLKKRKEQLGLKPGIESEPILDSATTGLYDDVSTGITDGAYASLSRALKNPDGEDAKKWAEQAEETKKKTKTGATVGGVGVAGGAVGNMIINQNKN